METGRPMRKRFMTAFLAVAVPAAGLVVLAAFPLSRWIYMGFGGLIIIIAAAIWCSLVSGLAEPAERLLADTEVIISGGKLAGGYENNNEIGRIGKNLAVLAKSLETLNGDLERLIKNDTAGKRLDEAKYPAARETAVKINALLMAFNELHGETAGMIKSIVKGEDISAPDKRAFTVSTELFGALTDLANHVNGYLRDVSKALDALTLGKTVNIRDGAYFGEFQRTLETIENLSAGLAVFSADAGNMAKGQARGDYTARIAATSFPAMAELASNMNNTANSIERMVGEVGDVFTAIKSGDYTSRYISGSPIIDEKAQAACKALAQRSLEGITSKPAALKTPAAESKTELKKEPFKRVVSQNTIKPVEKTTTKPVTAERRPTRSTPVVSVLKSSASDGSAEYNKKDFGKY